MDRLIDIYTKVSFAAGMLCLNLLSIAGIVWCLRSIIRSIIETHFVFKVRHYIEDTYRFMRDYERKLTDMQNQINDLLDMKKGVNESLERQDTSS